MRAALTSCLIYAWPLPAHPSRDQSAVRSWSAQGHDLTDDWSLPSAHFVDSWCPFRCLGAFFYWTRCFENNVPFDKTTPIYLINLLWKFGLGSELNSELHYFSISHGE